MQNGYGRMSVIWNYTDPFAAEDEGGDVIPTNRTSRAKSGGELVNGRPSFPAGSASAPRKELAFRIVPRLWCRTILGRTVCLSKAMQRFVMLAAAAIIVVTAAIALSRYSPWIQKSSRTTE